MRTVEAVLRRERAVVAAALAALAALAWVHIVRGAGMGMSAIDMTVNPRYGTFDPQVAAVVPDQPNWLVPAPSAG